ncbi:MAG: hypothetical protein K2X93_02025 [Candidatus Obscuribacterales bacterium]|nr:hypothetical protein [Candidatus Obscuribacterales bacterium]
MNKRNLTLETGLSCNIRRPNSLEGAHTLGEEVSYHPQLPSSLESKPLEEPNWKSETAVAPVTPALID